MVTGLEWLEQVKSKKIVVLCDSSSALFSLTSPCPETKDIVAAILALLDRIKLASVTVHFCLCVLQGKLAKEALNRSDVRFIPMGKTGAKAIN